MKKNKEFVCPIFLLLTVLLYSCSGSMVTPAPSLVLATPILTMTTPSLVLATPTLATATPTPQQPMQAFAPIEITQPATPTEPDLQARTIDGDLVVSGKQTIKDEKVVVNGQVRVSRSSSLFLQDAVLEVNYPADSFDSWNNNGKTSIYLEDGGGIEFTDSFIVTSQSRGMLATGAVGKVVVENCIFHNFQLSFHQATRAVIKNNTFSMPPDEGFSAAIELISSTNASVSGNTIVGEPSPNEWYQAASMGVDLLFSDNNEVRNNIIYGTKNGISLHSSSNNQVIGNRWVGPERRQGEAGISMEHWANNNDVEHNTLENAGSAILFIDESKHNKISDNIIRNAGLGIVLRWTSENIITNNTLEYILEDGVRAYRSYDNVIGNNQIGHAGEGMSLFTSWENQVGGNVIQAVDRGFYLFDAHNNQVQGNEVRKSLQSALAVQSLENVIAANNFIQSTLPAMEDTTISMTDTWQGNYWENAPSSIEESKPAAHALTITSVPIPDFQPINYGKMRENGIEIDSQVVWNGQTKAIDGSISIERGGRLVIQNSTVTFAPQGMQHYAIIEVQSGGVLDIEGSKIFGPEKDHAFYIKVHPDAEIVMKNSELHNAGSWVGDFGSAIGYQGKSAIIEDNIFENVYCAFSSKQPASNIQFSRNTIINTVEGITIIEDAPNTTIASNIIRQSAIWGIQIWSLSPHIGSTVSGNRVENGWGMGIFDAFANSFTIEPDNTFSNLKGPGLVTLDLDNAFLDGRQFRAISLTPTNVQAGDNVSISFDLMPFFPNPSGSSHGYEYVLSLTVNRTVIALKQVVVKYGETLPVTLGGKAPSAGVVELVIRANPD
jgi:parallel beta-helix repeat protein